MKKHLALFLFPALLACHPVGTDYTRPRLPLPESFQVPTGTSAPQLQWWSALGDPALTRLIAQAYAGSPDLHLAEARLRQARAQQGVQDAQGGPDLSMTGRVSRDRLSSNGEAFANVPTRNPKVNFTSYQAGFDASWELDLFGHQRRLSEAARARTESSAEQLDDARLVLAAEVARTYIELRTGQQRLMLADTTTRQLEELVRLAQVAFQAGDSSRQELAQAELNLSGFRSTVPDLEVGLRESLTRLATLTALPLEQVQAQVGPVAPLVAVPPAPAAGLPSDLLNRRPDLRGAERDLQAANADVGVALAERYPSFSLVGNAGWNSIQSGTLLQNASRTWGLGPQFSLPLFNQGRLKAQVRANQAAYDAALATYHKAVLTALADVDVAFTRLAQDERKRQQLLDGEARQRQLLDLVQRQFQAGDSARTAVLLVQRNLLGQQDQTLQAQSQSLVALVSVYKALGGGWAR
ncbi:MAG: efflux transporter outer membrane subunit [Holophaga sp.]|nr:efflux transporter outer membrane subunit [Holophaga sp.]